MDIVRVNQDLRAALVMNALQAIMEENVKIGVRPTTVSIIFVNRTQAFVYHVRTVTMETINVMKYVHNRVDLVYVILVPGLVHTAVYPDIQQNIVNA